MTGASSTRLDSRPKKTTAFKKLLQSPNLEFLMEAHNGLSARIVEEAGFSGIWASGVGPCSSTRQVTSTTSSGARSEMAPRLGTLRTRVVFSRGPLVA